MFLQCFLYFWGGCIFFKCLFLLNNKPTVQLFFEREGKTSGCTAQFYMLILVFHTHTHPHNIICFASHAVIPYGGWYSRAIHFKAYL